MAKRPRIPWFCTNFRPEQGSVRLAALFVTALIGAVLLTWFILGSRREGQPAARLPVASEAPASAGDGSPGQLRRMQSSADPVNRERSLLATAQTNSPVRAHLSVLLDGAQPLPQRRKAARSLAQLSTSEAVAALKVAFYDGPKDSQAAIAESLGACRQADALSAAQELIRSGQDRLALAAIRGLGDRGDAAAADVLRGVLLSEESLEAARIEAALSLSTVQEGNAGTQALQSLLDAAGQVRDEALLGPVLEGIASRPFDETRAFFRDFLASSSVPLEAKAMALENLGRTGGANSEFLLEYAANPEAKLRAAAALGLASVESDAELSAVLPGLVGAESDPQVRSRLYQAIAHQEAPATAEMLRLIQAEKDPRARLDALNLAAAVSATASNAEWVRFFNEVAVPELTQRALHSPSSAERVAAAVALSRLDSPATVTGIAKIAQETKDQRVVEVLRSATQRSFSPK